MARHALPGLLLLGLTGAGCGGPGGDGEALLAYGFGVTKSQRLNLETEASFAIVHGDRENLLSMHWSLIVRLDLIEASEDRVRWRVTIEKRDISTAGDSGSGADMGDAAAGVGSSYLGSLRRGLATLFKDEKTDLVVARTGRLVAGDRAVFEVLFPLLPRLPGGVVKTSARFESRARLILPVVGDVEVEQHGVVAGTAPDPAHRACLLDISLGGFQNGTGQGGPGPDSLYALDSVLHKGHDRIRLEAGTGRIVSRDLGYEADVRLRVRLGKGGLPVGPARLRVRLDHSARLLR